MWLNMTVELNANFPILLPEFMDIKDKIFKLLHLDNLIESVSGYLEARLDLYKIEIREDLAKVLARSVIYVAIAGFGFLVLMFLSIGLAHFLNRYFAETYAGFWIVAGIYGAGFLIFLIFRKSIDRNFEKHFVEMIKRKNK